MNFIQIAEKLKQLLEMSPTLKKEQTGLPVLLYASKAQASHGPRIKFQNQYSDEVDPNKWIPFTVSKNPELVKTKQKIQLSNEELNQIKQWIILNFELIKSFWYGKINFEEFKSKMTPLPNV